MSNSEPFVPTLNSCFHRCNPFIEYFYIFGLEPSIIKTRKLDEAIPSKVNEGLNATLLSKFPPIDRNISNINPGIIKKHCFPNGYIPIESLLNIKPKNKFFHFEIDNLLYLDSYKKVYFTTLIVYESINDYNYIKTTLANKIISDNIKDDEQMDSKKRSYSLNINTNKKFKRTLYQLLISARRKKRSKSVPLKSIKNLNKKITTVYFPKAICISSLYPFPEEKRHILLKIYNYIKSNNIKVPLEKIVEKLTEETPLPLPGLYKIKLDGIFNISLSRNPLNKFQVASYKSSLILNFLPQTVIEIYLNLLLEKPILFFCRIEERLTNVVCSFLSFLYPFEYAYPHDAILPEIDFGLIEMEDIFCFGINKKYSEKFFEKYNLNIINKNIVIVDLDKYELREFKKKSDEEGDKDLPIISLDELGMPKNNTEQTNQNDISTKGKYRDKLYGKIKDLQNQIKYKKVRPDKKMDAQIFEHFLYYCSISEFKDYHKYLYDSAKCRKYIESNVSSNSYDINNLFKVQEFLKSCPKNTISFYTEFFNTRIFYNFIITKYIPKNFYDKIKFLHFDESIAQKVNKKFSFFSKSHQVFFLDNEIFKIKEEYPVGEITNFSIEERLTLIKKNNKKQNELLANYFQRITKVNYKDNTYKLNYILFPLLLYDNKYFGYEYKEKEYPKLKNMKNEYLNLCKSMLDSQSSFFNIYKNPVYQFKPYDIDTEFIENEMENYIFLIWLRLFANTLYYVEEHEKEFRFYELLDNLEATKFIDHPTLSTIFCSLIKYGTTFMCNKFYEIIKKKEIINTTEYSYLCNKISSDKVFNENLKRCSIVLQKSSFVFFKEKEDKEYKLYEPDEMTLKSKLRRRKFGDKDISDEILFEQEPKCPECKKVFSLAFITLNFNKMHKISEMNCPFCDKAIVPKIRFKFKSRKSIDTFLLYSPYYLYKKIEFICSDINLKLDLDTFRKEYHDVFFNCIWYLALKGLSYEIILKYYDCCYGETTNDNLLCLPNENKVIEIKKFKELEIQKKVNNFFI